MTKLLKQFGLLLFITGILFACSDDDNNGTKIDSGIIISAPSYSIVSYEQVKLQASITANNTSNISKKGFCYGIVSGVTIFDNTVESKSSGLDIVCEMNNLEPEKTYYVKAFVTLYDGDPVYSSEVSFTTPAKVISGEEILAAYKAPVYADDYSPIASWGNRSNWNLANVHDPTIEKCGDYFYMYGTDASYGNVHEGHGHFPYRRSKDLVNWEFQGMAMSETPAWVKDTLNNMRTRLGLPIIENPSYGYWAPVVRKAGNKYRMYYSIVIDNYILTGKKNTTANFDGSWTERAFIGLMETDDLGSNQWKDKGMVVCSYSDKGKNWSRPNLNNWTGYFKWNSIDPTFIVTPEKEEWLIYGSWHSGIAAVQLSPETGKPLRELGEPWDTQAESTYGAMVFTRTSGNRWQGSEAPEIVYNEKTGYYYLFMAYDELSVAYNTRVFRSKNLTGPYTGDKIITHPYKFNDHSGWVGISHCCIFQDGEENWFYSSQGRLPANTNGNAYSNAIMMGHIRKIRWTEDGWPVVMPERYAAVPDVTIEESDLVGTWENIVLKYSYQNQQTSKNLVLTEDKKASGAINGTWSWDKANKILIVGNLKLCVEREVDWETTPRKHTLVYAGLNSAGESVWGKKK